MDNHLQIAYFPYLTLKEKDTIKIDNVEIWNFDKKKNEYIQDDKLRQHIENLLNINKINKQPITDIGVVTISNKDFRIFNKQELKGIKTAKLILFISFLAEHNIYMNKDLNIALRMATSENFELVIQNFALNDNFLSERTGFIVTKLVLGYQIGSTESEAPRYLSMPSKFSIDEKLLEQLLWLRRNNTKLFSRILRAVEIFYEAYYNSPAVSHNARILLQTSAFEVLLNLKDRKERKDFTEKIEKYCSASSDRKYSYKYEVYDSRQQRNIMKAAKNKQTLKGIWANRFYALRNHIIHGDTVRDAQFLYKGQPHFHIATLFFILCIKQLINEARQKSGSQKIFYDTINRDKLQNVMYTSEKIGFVYETNFTSKIIQEHIVDI